MTGLKIAIDIGSTNITFYTENKGIVICEPSCMIKDKYSGKIIATGLEAGKMSEKLPSSMEVFYPIKNGYIYDYDSAVVMFRNYLDRLCRGRILRPSVLMCVPGIISPLEKRTIFDAIIEAGAGKACFVDQALASAIGAGVDIYNPAGTMIVDIGASTTDAAVIAGGNIVYSAFSATGGNTFTQAIKEATIKEYNSAVCNETAEQIKQTVCSAIARNEEVAISVPVKNVITANPGFFEVSSSVMFNAFESPLNEIRDTVIDVIDHITPELCSDIYDNGVILTGGTSNLYGMTDMISQATHLNVRKAESPDLCAALGMGKLLDKIDFLEKHGYIFKSSENKEISDD